MKRMICYRRVSTDDQADKGYSLPSQLEAIKAYAVAHGFEIAADFADDYSGATPIADRPEGKKAIAMLRRHEADGIITHHVDRLSRDLVDALATVRDLTRAGLEVHSLDVGRISAETDIVLVIKAWQGSDERKKITERTTRGRNQKAKSGKAVGAGKPPYGYRYQDGEFVIDEAQAHIVQLIYQWYVTGDESGRKLPLYSIRKRLSESGVKPPYVNRSKSGEWGINTVCRILDSETYAGVWRYGKKVGNSGIGGKRDKADQIAVSVPPIIDRELWEAAQVQRKINAQMSVRNCKSEYLLRGRIKCTCGRSLSGATSRGVQSYSCSGRYWFVNDIRGCKVGRIRADIVERHVIDWIVAKIEDPIALEADLREAQRRQLETQEPKRGQVENFDALIATAMAELKDNLAMMRGLDEHSRRYKMLQLDGDEIEARISKLETRKAALETEITAQVTTNEDIRDIVTYSRDALEGIENPTFEQKRRWLDVLQVQVYLTSQTTAKATCILSGESLVIDSLTS
jgi:site-specific DNA recombinase